MYKSHEDEKKQGYNSGYLPRVLQVEKGTFTPVIFSTFGPVSNLFKVGRQLNFLSYLGRNEKIILIFRRDARVTSCARRAVDYTHARVGRRSR